MANVIEITIRQSGQGNAISTTIKDLGRLGSAASSSGGLLGGFGKSLGGVFSIAGGIIAADIFKSIASSITGLVSTALGEFAKYERMALSVQSLVARELSQGQQVEVQRQVLAGLTKKEADELGGLADKIKDEELARNTLHARIKEQSESLRQLRDAHGDEALNVQTATARLAELENQYNESGKEIDNMKNRVTELTGKEGQLVTVMDKVRTGQMSMTDAMEQAGPRAAELLTWISKLAVMSPFNEEGIQGAFQTALAYGFTTEAAQRLTQAEVDFAAATGKSVEVTNLIALALGQMQAKGKVSGQELIQLTNAGVGVNKILEDMGFTLDDVSNGLVDSETFIEAVIKDMEIFKGAGAAQAETFSGLISTLSDLKAIGLREFFTGTFTAIQPYLAGFVSMLTSAALETGSIRALGDAFGTYVAGGLERVMAFVTRLTGAFQRFGLRGVGVSLLGQLGLDPTQIAGVMGVVDQITGAIDKITGAFERFGAKGATVSILGMLGMDPETIGFIFTTFDTIIEKIGIFQQIYAQFGAMGAGLGLLSMLGFSSETIGFITVSIQTIIESFTALSNWWITNWPLMQATALTAWEVIKGIFAGFQTALGPTLTQLQAQFIQVFNQISQVLASFGISWSEVWNALLIATGVVAAGIGAAIVGVIGVVAGLATGIGQGVSAAITMFQNLATNVSGIFTGLTIIFVGWVETFKALLAGDFAGAWEGFKIVLQGAVTFWSNMWGGMITVAVGTLDIMTSAIGGFVEGIVGFFQGLYNSLVGNSIVPDLINEIVAWFKKLPNLILNTLSTLASRIAEPFENTWEAIKEAINIDEWTTLGTNAIEGLLEGMKEKAGEVLEFIKSLAMDSLTGLGQFWGAESPAKKFMPLGASIPQGLVVGINQEAPKVNSALRSLGQGAMNSLMTGMSVTDSGFVDRFIDDLDMGGIGKAAGAGGGQWRNFRNILINEITAGMSGLEAGSIDFMSKITEVANRFHFPPNLAREFAEAEGLVEHLTGTFGTMFQKLRIENLSASTALASQFAGIGQSFADMIKDMSSGFGVATEEINKLVEKNGDLSSTFGEQKNKMATLQEELAKLTTGQGQNAMAIEKVTESLGFGERQLAIYNEELAKLTPDTLAWDKKKLAIDKLTETMDMQRQQLEKLQVANESDALAIEKKRLAIEDLTQEMNENQAAIAKNEAAMKAYRLELEKKAFAGFNPFAGERDQIQGDLAMIELFQDFLKGTGNEMRIVGEELGGIFAGSGITSDIIHNRASAQAELNRLLAEQAEREQAILDLEKSRQQLDFLGQQLNLMKMLSDRGLNPADILGGITLGLEASAQDLLAATTAVVTAMVEQINSDLQIASPSKLLFKMFRDNVGGAMAGGLMAAKPILQGVIEPVLSPIVEGANQAGRVVNNYFNQTVNTMADQSSVIGDFRTMQLMAGS